MGKVPPLHSLSCPENETIILSILSFFVSDCLFLQSLRLSFLAFRRSCWLAFLLLTFLLASVVLDVFSKD